MKKNKLSYLIQLRNKILQKVILIESLPLSILFDLLNFEIELLDIDYNLGNMDLIDLICESINKHQVPSKLTDDEFMRIIERCKNEHVTIVPDQNEYVTSQSEYVTSYRYLFK